MSGNDVIPRPEFHRHGWYPFQIKNSFEPIPGSDPTIYTMREYQYSSCKCGAGTKTVVEPS